MLDIAVLGAGRIGRIHAGNIAAHPDARLAGIADTVPEAAARRAKPGRISARLQAIAVGCGGRRATSTR